ncbi:MAG TPA: GMC family oxidoreductase [Blastocatellia bacterium]|nr:GMC family oxidoreductase [Blastocatellia bacterium]
MTRTKVIYDAIIVGSGAAGGIAAHVLVNRGLNVLLLEIGPKWNPAEIFQTEHSWPYEMPFRGLGRPGEYDGLWKVNAYTEHLYVHPRVDRYAVAPGTDFHWTRIHAVGGRTNTWGRVSLRMSEFDFKPKSLQDGVGEDWPLSYSDLAPYYDRAETLMGVFGTKEGLAVLPDGIYHAPTPPPRCGEAMLTAGGGKIGIPVIPIRRAMALRNYQGRAACHYCGACDRGCSTSSRFNTLDAIIPGLVGKKNFTLRTHAAVHRVLMDPKTNRARGVEFIDTRNRLTYEAHARVTVLGAGAMASTRILLNSKTRVYPTGLANSSGALGHYLMDSFKAGMVSGYLPKLNGGPITNDDGAGGGHIYIPRSTNLPGGPKSPFLRGYQFQPGSGADIFPGYARRVEGFGSQFKKQVRDQNPARIGMTGFGEQLPDFNNYCEIDPDGLKDRYGIPQLRFNAKWGENDLKMADAMYDTAEELLRAAGAEITPYQRRMPPPPGDATHEVGTARMGEDPKTSVLNRFNQAHDVKNLFVVDGASFVSLSEKNCTLTIAAVSWRASEYLAEELRRDSF